tara:strand:+ start:3489 stop:5660 length:2172 start_codon:yes stop_codon:yes gene_type:complete
MFLKKIQLALFFTILITWACSGKVDTMDQNKEYQNRLAQSQSPYLLQHATNPVDWYPWGDEAFIKAKKENKPIFLSIGYSTCHWCHVMEHESFEDSTVAALMNENFISIKVDREEMPEVDHLYMSVCQAMTGRGGWPLTIVMTPDKEPFFAGTYFPKNGRSNQPGMLQLIPSLANAWTSKQSEILNTTEKVRQYLEKANSSSMKEDWEQEMIHKAFNQYANRYDPEFGGFGRAPKFPSPHNLIFLLRYSKLYNDTTALKMAKNTLQHMRQGGMFDHIGLGFHRYSTDKRWFLPHFEKMLYDQAMLAMAYLEAFQYTRDAQYSKVAEEIFTYVLRDMTDLEGGFYSAEDADSEGEEGKFYIWTTDEFIDILGKESGETLANIYGFRTSGNFHDEASGKTSGNNIIYYPSDVEKLAKNVNMSQEKFDEFITIQRDKLFQVRKKRIHPLKDDKILTDWNGLMIAALALGGQVLDKPKYKTAAEKAARFVLKKLRGKDGRLKKRYRQNIAGLPPHLDDYAFMTWGLLNLYEATFQVEYLQEAINLTEIMANDFLDHDGGGFFIGSNKAEKLMVRAKDSYDGAIPSGNSVAAMNLVRINRFTGNPRWLELANNTLRAFTDGATQSPTGFAHMLTAFMFDTQNSKEIVIVGQGSANDTQMLLDNIRSIYIPNRVILFKDMEQHNDLNVLAPWTKEQGLLDNKPTIYICKNFVCNLPTTRLNTALKYLNE